MCGIELYNIRGAISNNTHVQTTDGHQESTSDHVTGSVSGDCMMESTTLTVTETRDQYFSFCI